MKKKLFKSIALLAAMASVIGLYGCGQKDNAVVMEDPNTVPETPYEINWYICGKQQSDVASVENEINAYLKDKINATVKLNILESAQYGDKLSNMIQSGEYFDMCFVANWKLDYAVNAENGAFYPLDDLFEAYMPKTYEASDKEALACAKVGGKVYALPVIKENADAAGWIYRKDIADKYHIDMSQVQSYEDLLPIARTIKENEPDIKYPVEWKENMSLSGNKAAVTVIQGKNLGFVPGDDTYTVINRLENPDIMKQFKLAHQYYEEGLVRPDILTSAGADYVQNLKNGKIFCALAPLKPGKINELLKNAPYEFAQEYITEVKKPLQSGVASMNAISATSKNPVRVARFMELLNTDPVLNNMVIFGLEGRNYTKVEDNVIKLIPNSGYNLSDAKWMIANVFIGYATDEEDPQINAELKKFNDEAKPNPLSGFVFVTESVQQEIAACQAVEIQYEGQASLGALDPETVVPEYLKELKAAGIDKVKEELQRQINEFLKNKE